MDQDLLRQIEFFSTPNNQTMNPLDQAGERRGSVAGQVPPLWDPSALFPESPSTIPTRVSVNSLAQSSTAPTNMSFSPRPSQPSQFGAVTGGSGSTAKAPRTKDGHDRKRVRMNSGTMPYDSVDYWLQFDNEEAGLETAGSDHSKADLNRKGKTPVARRSSSMSQTVNSIQPPPPPPPLPPQPQPSSQAIPAAVKLDEVIDDTALENALSDDDDAFSSMNLAEQLSKIDSMPPSDIPPREGLYSTPLSWERPQMGLRIDSLIGLQSPTLTEAEQRRLIAIAMNTGPSMGGLGSSLMGHYGGLMGGFGGGLGTASMSQIQGEMLDPKPPAPAPQPQPSKAAKPSSDEKGKEKPKQGERTAHNDIEKKYRTNLKDKIAELRDAVPSLRTIPEDGVDDGDGSSQPARAPKVSKGTVLLKATEYIHHLEKKNRAIMQQHQHLARRLQAFEQLLSATVRPAFQMPNYSRTLFDPRAFC